jgi:hypothetical protein
MRNNGNGVITASKSDPNDPNWVARYNPALTSAELPTRSHAEFISHRRSSSAPSA